MNHKKFVELLWMAVQKRDSYSSIYEIWEFWAIFGQKQLVAPSTDVGYLHEESPTEGWGVSIDLDRDF
jgi:hypothetical protein